MIRFPLPALFVVLLASAMAASPSALGQETFYTVSGTVLSDQGDTLEGVHVSLYVSSGNREGSTSQNVVTGADGAFSFKAPAGKGTVSAYHPKWGSNAHQDLEVSGDVSGLVLTLRSPPPKTALVEGRVLDQDGNPVPGALVRFSNYPAYEGGDEPRPMPAVAEPAPATEPASDADSSVGDGGEGRAGMIAPYPCCYSSQEEQRTGDDGAFRFEAFVGSYNLWVSHRGYTQANADGQVRDGETRTADLTLHKIPPADAIVKGRVLDARTGLPLAGAQVSLNNVEWGRYAWAETGKDGTYRLETIPGWIQVHVSHYGRPQADLVAQDDVARPVMLQNQYHQHAASFRVASSEQTHDVRLEPKPEPTHVLLGYAVDPEAKTGIPNAQIQLWNQETGDWGSATTDATGSYKILVRPGYYTLNAWAGGHLPTSQTFQIAQDEPVKRLDVALPKGEQKYAPCDECFYDATVAGDGTEKAVGAPAMAAGPNAPAAAPTPMTPPAPGGLRASAESASEGDSSSQAVFVGSGGGLPPYDPDAASSLPAATSAQEVPAPGLLAVLGLLGVLAYARRR